MARGGALVGILVGLLALLGWACHVPILASFHSSSIPMAPSTAVCCVLLGANLMGGPCLDRPRPGSFPSILAVTLAALISLVRLTEVALGSRPRLDGLFSVIHELRGGVELGVMAPLTAGALLLACGAALLLHLGRSQWTRSLAQCTSLPHLALGLVAGLSYLGGSENLEDLQSIPVALPTCLALVALGVGTIASSGAGAWPLVLFVGDTVRARLMRAMVPMVVVIVLIDDPVDHMIRAWFSGSIMGPMVMAAMASMLLVSAVAARAADTIGSSVDTAHSKLREAIDALRVSEEKFQSMTDIIPHVFWMANPDSSRILFVSSSYERVWGRTCQSLYSAPLSWTETIHPEDRDRAVSAIMGDREVTVPFRIVVPDGTVKWIRNQAYVLRGPEGVIRARAGLAEDITDTILITERLLEEEGRRRAILETAVDSIITIDTSGTIETANLATERLFGYPVGELIGQSIGMLMPPPHQTEHMNYLQRYVTSGVSTIIGVGREVSGLKKGGTVFPLSLMVSEFRIGAKRMFTGIARDITERVSMEGQIRQAQKMEAVGQLAGGVAHDFNNVLAVILGYTDLVLGELPSDHPTREMLQTVFDAATRGASLTRQLLAFSRREVLVPRVFDWNVLVRDLEKMLRRLVREDVQLETQLDAPISWVKADSGLIEQVLMNLVVNARDAMPGGGKLIIRTSNVEVDEAPAGAVMHSRPGTYVMTAVIDTGIGMDSETQARIFEPFFTTKKIGHGTGLGLSVVHGIVSQSQGFIRVRSQPGHGSTFEVYLPTVAEALDRKSPSSLHNRRVTEPKTILVVDDQLDVRRLCASILRRLGHHVLEAGSVDEACAAVAQHPGGVDLLLTDVVMPGGSGRDLIRHMAHTMPGLPVIYMSGYTDDVDLLRELVAAGVPFLEKPFTAERLSEMVAAAIAGPAT